MPRTAAARRGRACAFGSGSAALSAALLSLLLASLPACAPAVPLKRGSWLAEGGKHETTYGNAHKEEGYMWRVGGDMIAAMAQFEHREEWDVYQFGVYSGGTMAGIREAFGKAESRVRFGTMWGFDSFEGLPPESKGIGQRVYGRAAALHGLAAGAFSTADALKETDPERVYERLRSKIQYPRVGFVRGFYSESLTNELFQIMPFQKAFLVDVDVDLYTSTIEALDWMFAHGLIVPGTWIRYDDWFGTVEYEGGESKAHVEMMEKWHVQCKRQHPQLYLVVGVGDSGFVGEPYPVSARNPSPKLLKEEGGELAPHIGSAAAATFAT